MEPFQPIFRRLLDHAAENGVDWEYGGIFRDGLRATGKAIVLEKEFWQHSEALVGFLDGYELFREPRLLDAFGKLWGFVQDYMIIKEVGEWRTLLDRFGKPLDAEYRQSVEGVVPFGKIDTRMPRAPDAFARVVRQRGWRARMRRAKTTHAKAPRRRGRQTNGVAPKSLLMQGADSSTAFLLRQAMSDGGDGPLATRHCANLPQDKMSRTIFVVSVTWSEYRG